QVRGLGASLLAEHAVGERDTITLVSSLQAEPLPEDPAAAGLRPFRELSEVFDAERGHRYPPPGFLPLNAEGEWQAMRGTIQGEPALALFNAGLRRLAGHPDYDRRLTVRIPFNEPRPDGMPATEQEYLAVEGLGHTAGELLQEKQESLLAMTIMSQGRRDVILYTADADAALRRLDAWRADVETHRVEINVEWDSFWGMYR